MLEGVLAGWGDVAGVRCRAPSCPASWFSRMPASAHTRNGGVLHFSLHRLIARHFHDVQALDQDVFGLPWIITPNPG